MDRIWQWAWDRHGARYSWVIWGIALASAWLVHLGWSFVVVGFEKSSHYVEAAVVSGVAMVLFASVAISPGVGSSRVVDPMGCRS